MCQFFKNVKIKIDCTLDFDPRLTSSLRFVYIIRMFLTLSSVVSTFGNLARFQAELFPVSEYHIDVVVFSVPLIEVEMG